MLYSSSLSVEHNVVLASFLGGVRTLDHSRVVGRLRASLRGQHERGTSLSWHGSARRLLRQPRGGKTGWLGEHLSAMVGLHVHAAVLPTGRRARGRSLARGVPFLRCGGNPGLPWQAPRADDIQFKGGTLYAGGPRAGSHPSHP